MIVRVKHVVLGFVVVVSAGVWALMGPNAVDNQDGPTDVAAVEVVES